MGQIFTIGETTYDIVFRDGNPMDGIVGGSVLNTSVTLGRLGLPIHFISRIGNDKIADLSLDFLKNNGVSCEGIVRFEGNSRLALAFMDHDNNASYSFYKAQKAPELVFPNITQEDIVVFGSTHAVREEGRNGLLLFLNEAHDKNVLSVYDPNIREFSVLELIDVRKKVEENLHLTKVLKGSIQDFERLYNTRNIDEIYNEVKMYGAEILIVTQGAKTVELRTPTLNKSFVLHELKTVSTIGAGDNFTAGLVYGFYTFGIKNGMLHQIDENKWEQIIQFGIRFSGEVCQSSHNYISQNFANHILSEQLQENQA